MYGPSPDAATILADLKILKNKEALTCIIQCTRSTRLPTHDLSGRARFGGERAPRVGIISTVFGVRA